MARRKRHHRVVVLRIDSYEGEDTFLRCGDERQDHLFAILAVGADGTAEIIDSSYRTIEEALRAWPEARKE